MIFFVYNAVIVVAYFTLLLFVRELKLISRLVYNYADVNFQ